MKSILKFSHQLFFNVGMQLFQVLPDNNFGNKIRGNFAGLFFKKKGRNLLISKSVGILYPQNISVGDDVFFGFNCWINAQGGLNVENEVMLGPFVALSTSNHTSTGESFRFGEHSLKSVKIGSGSWLGAHVTVTAGSDIPPFCLIAAGSTIVGKIERSGLYVGAPAKFKKDLK
ncbi:acyltransferase [Vibrio navarrensis]|uniref:acyltransferase n=1 Tax=Vibrio navarrensis TaxID=29495 RepID=UPI001869C9EB|nr:acyltransferase [Vibrio navarrensis]MBE4605627.1 hypothetical protein [Vibrio navarrensis]